MQVTVKLFAVARQRAGRDAVTLELPAEATVRQLRGALCEQCPPLADLLPHVRIAVNSEYASDTQVLPRAGEIALIPPVSGG
jgi:molybdopterin converting factor subunit 1